MNEQAKSRLHFCMNKDTADVFFASLDEMQPGYGDFRSSTRVEKGDILMMMALPEGWDGQDLDPQVLLTSSKAFEANVIRSDPRGLFRVRVLSLDQQDMMARMRGRVSSDHVEIETNDLGAMTEMVVEGRIGLESVGRLQKAIQTGVGSTKSCLLNFSAVIYISKNALPMLTTVIHELQEKGILLRVLLKSDSPIEEMISHSRMVDEVGVFTDRDAAVQSILMAQLD